MAEITWQDVTHQESHRIIHSDGLEDSLTSTIFESFDTAYDALEHYFRDLCCSDDDCIEYTIVTETKAMASIGNGNASAQNAGINRTENQKSLA